VLIEEPGRVILDGLLRESVAVAAGESLKAVADPATRDTHLDLYRLFKENGVPMRKGLIKKCIKRWGSRAVEIIQANPFRLMTGRFPGIGFNAADRMYLRLGLPLHALKRQTLAAWHHIAKKDGDTWLPLAETFRAVQDAIGGATVQPRKAIKLGLRTGWFGMHLDGDGMYWLAERRKADAEERLARHVKRLCACKVALWPKGALPGLSDHQQAELTKALTSPVALLTGSPGTGKTFTATAAVRAIADLGLMRLVAVCAPTGKASVRITSAMRAAGLPIDATTIHRLLGPRKDGGAWKFAHDEDSQLPHRIIVVDEVSMLDADIAAALFAALEDGTHILLVGDVHQLAPVGHGAPLRDLLGTGLPAARLTEIQRNSGSIVRACVHVKEGEHFETMKSLKQWNPDAPERNLIHLSCRGEEAIDEQLSAVYTWLDKAKRWDLVNEVQVICARNKTRQRLNRQLRDRLNANPPSEHPTFRIGDKVICLKNDFYASVGPSNKDRPLVANGDFGCVTGFRGRQMEVVLTAPDRRVLVPLGKTDEGQDSGADDDNEVVKANGCRWDLAYCCTTHKYQGSECPVVIVVLDAAGLLSSRELLYTAVSRAKQLCVLIAAVVVEAELIDQQGQLGRLGEVERTGGGVGVFGHGGTAFVGDNRATRRP
jgi:exodeoxyribonuclease V alpha subunit